MSHLPRHTLRFCVALLVGWLSLAAFGVTMQPDTADQTATVIPSGEIPLARLVDMAAQRLQVNIEYDPSLLRGTVTIRVHVPLDDASLWNLTNRLLAREGLTTVALDSADVAARSFAVAKISDAASVAGRDVSMTAENDPGPVRPGFRTVVIQPDHVRVEYLESALQTLLSKQQGSGQVARLGDAELLIVSDLAPRVDQALRLIELLDQAQDPPDVRRFELRHASAIELVAAVNAVMSASSAVSGSPSRGKLMVAPSSSGNAALLVAPEQEIQHWTALVESFDRDRGLSTRNYIPRFFDASEVAGMLDELVHHADGTSRDDGEDGWRVVVNDFTGALVVTATSAQHRRVEALLNELNALPVETRRPIRTFKVRNRSVGDLLNLLSQLIDAGALQDGLVAGPATTSTADSTGDPVRQGSTDDALRRAPGGNNATERQQPRDRNNEGLTRQSLVLESTGLRLTADEATSTIIAVGEPRMLSQLERLVATLDVRQPQVMLEVLIVSMSDGRSLDLGVELRSMGVTGNTFTTLSSLFGLSSGSDDGITPSLGDPRGGTAVILNPGDFSVVIRALETVNEGRSLNIPRVLVNNNEQATLDSVLQQPLLSVNASDTVATTSFGGTQDAGTQVTVTPQIAEGDHLLVRYTITLSSFVGESSDPSLPPPRLQNTLSSIATIPDGFVIAMGGLEVTTDAEAESKVPLLGDLPVVGEAFKNRSTSTTRSRFYVFIRPMVLRHETFADLRHVSRQTRFEADLEDGHWPTVKPQVIY